MQTTTHQDFFMSSKMVWRVGAAQSCGAEFDGSTAGPDVFGHCSA
jgi:hypothetical protein